MNDATNSYRIETFAHSPHTIPGASPSAAGVLTSTDKAKLDAIPTGAGIGLLRIVELTTSNSYQAADGDMIVVRGALETGPHVSLPPASDGFAMVCVKNYTNPVKAVVVQPFTDGTSDTIENSINPLQLTTANSSATFVSEPVNSNWMIVSKIT